MERVVKKSKWATIVVKRGEGDAHLYADREFSVAFFAEQVKAIEQAERYCKNDPNLMVLVMRAEGLSKAMPIAVEVVSAA